MAYTDLDHKDTKTSNSNIYHYRGSTLLSIRHQQTRSVFPEVEIENGWFHAAPRTNTTKLSFGNSSKSISAVWAQLTKSKYKWIFKKWESFCGKRIISAIKTDEGSYIFWEKNMSEVCFLVICPVVYLH